ncbi:MAG: ABC transporter substrate-binding protein [Deltaproteobacteria bacterium]|nr:ABC transporter substrate-binding protein [Deltaproteobacteria bacterium]
MARFKLISIWMLCVFSGVIFFISSYLKAEPNDTVTVAINSEPTTINQVQWKTDIDGVVTFPMHQLLAGRNYKGHLDLTLAKSVQPSAGATRIKVKMKKGGVFHTGDPVTAHDVKFSYEQVLDPENANVTSATFGVIDEIEIVDDYTMIFNLYDPMAQWEESLFWPVIHSKKYYEKVGRKKFLKHPIGSGPFKFVERKIGESITYERFDGYVDVAPENTKKYADDLGVNPKVNFKTLKMLIVPDAITRIAMFETGEVDLIYDIEPYQIKGLQKNSTIKIKKAVHAPSLFGIAYRVDNFPFLKDKNLKWAIATAINRQEIIDKAFLGEGYPLYMYANKVEEGYDPKYKTRFKFNLEKSRAYLKKSSYKPGTPLMMTYPAGLPQINTVAPMIQDYLKQAGITIELVQLEAGTFITYSFTNDKRLGPLSIYSWAGEPNPNFRLQASISSNSSYCVYRTRPNKEEIDALVEAQAYEPDKVKRRKILAKIHKELAEDSSGTILYGLHQIYAMSNRIEWVWSKKAQAPFSLSGIRMVK